MRRQSSVFTLSKSYSRRKSETPPPAPVDLTRLTLDETSEEGSVSIITQRVSLGSCVHLLIASPSKYLKVGHYLNGVSLVG